MSDERKYWRVTIEFYSTKEKADTILHQMTGPLYHTIDFDGDYISFIKADIEEGKVS